MCRMMTSSTKGHPSLYVFAYARAFLEERGVWGDIGCVGELWPFALEKDTFALLLRSNSATTTTSDDVDSLQLLAGLRHKFQQTEQELYAELAHTSEKNLNDVRRSFVTAARGATKRLAAWEKKHSSEAHAGTSAEGFVVPEPEWWKDGCHAVPGGNVIVREDDWGSIIAFTLRWVW